MIKSYCNYCDPKYFVIYGFCGNCGRRCEPPLFNMDGKINFTLEEYLDFKKGWNAQRADLITDAIRRDER
jgi:hypothetical protein